MKKNQKNISRIRKATLIAFIFFAANWLNAQTQILDSLKNAYKIAKHDTTRAGINVQFSEILYLSNPDTVIPLCKHAIELAENNIAKANASERKKFLEIEGNAYNNIGYIFQNRGDVKSALENYHTSLKIQEDINDLKGIAQTLNNIGFIYQSQNDISKTLTYYEKSLAIREKINDKRGIAETLNNIGLVYRKNGDPNCKSKIKDACIRAGVEKALKYYLRSLRIKEEVNDQMGISVSYNNIGAIYNTLNDFEKALDYFVKSLAIREKLRDKQGMSVAYNNMGGTYFRKGDFENAEKYCLRSLELARDVGFPENIRRTSETLKNIYKANGNSIKALEMYEVYISMRDSINSREANREAQKQHFKLEYEKKAATDSLRVKNEKEVVNLQLEHKKNQSYFLILGLVLVLFFAAFMFNRFKITQKQKQFIEVKEQETLHQKILIENKQKEIVDSINYAQRIQKALLANDSLLEANLPEHFVIYKPKAIVSGDFYWASAAEKNMFFLAVCDSTGHGVPGAFMSLLNISFLNEAVSERKMNDPATILNHVRERVIQSLSSESGQDGMDCSFTSFDFKNKILKYASANNHMWIVRQNRLIELNLDKMPVGKHSKDQQSFTSHEVSLQSGDMIYLFTDGFADQFGGPKGKKLMYRKMQELILSVNLLSASAQKEKLNEVFEDWKGNLEQVDDVCIIGVRV